MNLNSIRSAYKKVISEESKELSENTPKMKNLRLADIIKNVRFKPFSEYDYDSYSGVESEDPLIGLYDGHEYVLDGNVLEVYSDDMEEGGVGYELVFKR
jgi:hypothetical protein